MNSRNNRSLDMKPNHVKNSDLMSVVYSEPLRVYKKPKFGIGDRVRISKYDLPFRKIYINHNIHQQNFEIVAIATKKAPTCKIKVKQDEVLRGKFYEKEKIRVISVCFRVQQSWFPTHLCSSFQTLSSIHLQISCQNK